MANILIVYSYKVYPPRTTHMDTLYSFRRYSSHKCYYLNMWFQKLPWYLDKINFDLILFHYTFFDLRYSQESFTRLIHQFSRLRQPRAVRIAMPQDEYTGTDLISEFINKAGVDLVFSVAPESEWPKIYSAVDQKKVRFFRVLTGYLDDHTLEIIAEMAQSAPQRDVDIGYRVRFAPFLGRFGLLKIRIAELFLEKSPQFGLVADISCRDSDAFWGYSWYKFLLRCKYTLGVEGGASLLDRNGRILQHTLAYCARYPQADFEEIAARFFPDADGSLDLKAISPRHLEACATRTCQILVEGEYNGILTPGLHYIALKKDFSNLVQVLDLVQQDNLREEITTRAYRDIVESGLYNYQGFVNFVLTRSLGLQNQNPGTSAWADNFFFHWMRIAECLSWTKVALFRLMLKMMPGAFLERLRRKRQANLGNEPASLG